MSDYEPYIHEITCYGDSHRHYIVRDYRGQQWEARGDRLVPEQDWWLDKMWRERSATLKAREKRVARIINSAPWWRFVFKRRLRERMQKRLERAWKKPGTDMYQREFGRIENPLLKLPPVPAYADLMKPDHY